MRKTPWFDGEANPPVRAGLYEVKRKVSGDCVQHTLLQFDGVHWTHALGSGANWGLKNGHPALMLSRDGDIWRGLAEKPK